MFKWLKRKYTLRDARLALTEQKEYWDYRYRWGDIFLDADMEPTMEAIDEALVQLDKLQKLGYDSDPEGVERIMARRWAKARATPPAHGGERPNYAPSKKPKPQFRRTYNKPTLRKKK